MPRLSPMKSFRARRKTADISRNELAIFESVSADLGAMKFDDDEQSLRSLLEPASASFSPQRSRRIAKNPIHPCADNDTWVEIIILLKPDPKTQIREKKSLFYSINTKRAYWDEPLSGASNIILADDNVNPFVNTAANTSEDDVWVEIVVSARKTAETRPLFYSMLTHRAHWDRAPANAKNVLFVRFMEDTVFTAESKDHDHEDCDTTSISDLEDDDDDDMSVGSI